MKIGRLTTVFLYMPGATAFLIVTNPLNGETCKSSVSGLSGTCVILNVEEGSDKCLGVDGFLLEEDGICSGAGVSPLVLPKQGANVPGGMLRCAELRNICR
jgi:hypothetical protein